MKKWEDMYRHYQNGQKPDETKVKNAVAQALGSSDNHASGHAAEPERHKRAISFTRGRTVAAAAAAVLCICMSVPVIAGIAENIIGKSKFDSYTQLHSVDNRYIGYSDETVESSDVRLNIDRYMRIDNDAIVELTLKNINDRPGEKYNYRAEFATVSEDGSFSYMANGMPSNESVVISVGKDYDAQNNSTHIVYLIKDVPDMLVVGPSSNDKEWRQKRAQYTLNNIIRQGEKNKNADDTAKLVEESGYFILLNVKDTPVYNSNTQGIIIDMDEDDIAQARLNYPSELDNDEVEMRVSPVTFTITDFGIEARFETKIVSDYVWRPAMISLVYNDGSVKRIAPERSRYKDIPVKERQNGNDITIVTCSSLYYERKNKTDAAAQQYSDNYSDFYDGYSNIHWHLDEVIDTSSIKTVIVDGVSFDVNK